MMAFPCFVSKLFPKSFVVLLDWWREIKAVGFKDWWWFVRHLKRDEFSPKLNVWNYWRGYDLHPLTFYDLGLARARAHRISNTLDDLKRAEKEQRIEAVSVLRG